MKKMLFTAVLCMLVQYSFAQLQKGTWATTGTVSYSQNKQKSDAVNDFQSSFDDEFKSLQLRPTLGFFINDNVELGLLGGYSNSDYTSASSTARSSTLNTYEVKTYSAGLYTRLYKFMSENFAVFGHADISYNYSDVLGKFEGQNAFNKYTYTYNTDVNSVSANIRPGVSFFVHDRISLNATYGALSYAKYNNDHKREELIFGDTTTSEYSTDSYDLKLDLSSQSFGLGVSLYFR